MNPDLANLIELEKIDQKIAALNREVAELPLRVAAIEEKLAGSRSRVEAARAHIKDNEAQRRKLDAEIQAQQQKISKYREQSLEVKTNEQYRALMHEIEFAEQNIRKAEDKILELMVDSEERERELKAAELQTRSEADEVEKEKAEARERTVEDERLLAEQRERRNQLRSQVSEGSLATYDRIHGARGTAIAEAIAQKCSACHVLLRPQKYNELRSNEQVLTCDSCGRILFYDPAHETETPKKSRRKPPSEESTEAEVDSSLSQQ